MDRRSFLLGTLAAALVGAHSRGIALAAPAIRKQVTVPEVELIRADTGKLVALREVMGDRIVALNFLFTDCAATCPMQAMVMSRAQALLTDVLGKQAMFVSVSLDPTHDTPAKLQQFAQRHKASSAWHFFTGDARQIESLRAAFEAQSAARDGHPPVIAIGRTKSKEWSRLYGFPKPELVAEEVRAWL